MRKNKVLVVVFVLSMVLPLTSLANNPSEEVVDPTPTLTPIPVQENQAMLIQLAEGEKAIDDYLTLNGIVIDKNSEEYQELLYAILNDVYLDLWVSEKQEAITYYAISELGLQPDTETKEVDLQKTSVIFLPLVMVNSDAESNSVDTLITASPLAITASYNRTNAVTYANDWVKSGDKKRNSAYPDFTNGGDCTNFVSQVAKAGGISMRGNGTCRDESTTTEWYVYRLSSPCGWPWQTLRDWKWSTSWSLVRDFRYYMRDKESAYVEAYPANKEAVSLLISRARTGDFIQLDVRSCSTCSWTPTHSVVVVEKKNNGGYYLNDVLYNDHSGSTNGNDTVKGSLRAKYQSWVDGNVTNLRRMVWIKMP